MFVTLEYTTYWSHLEISSIAVLVFYLEPQNLIPFFIPRVVISIYSQHVKISGFIKFILGLGRSNPIIQASYIGASINKRPSGIETVEILKCECCWDTS